MGPSPNTRWTDEEDALLRRLRAEGVSSSKIAVQIGKSRNAVIGRASRMGLPSVNESHRPDPNRPRRPQGRPQTRPTGVHLPGHNRVRAKAARPRPQPVAAADAPAPSGVGLIALTSGDCHWPYGDGPFTFCGHRVDLSGRQPYCGYHRAASYRPRNTND